MLLSERENIGWYQIVAVDTASRRALFHRGIWENMTFQIFGQQNGITITSLGGIPREMGKTIRIIPLQEARKCR